MFSIFNGFQLLAISSSINITAWNQPLLEKYAPSVVNIQQVVPVDAAGKNEVLVNKHRREASRKLNEILDKYP